MNVKVVIASVLFAMLGACASTPMPTAALDTARNAVHSAEADPNVPKYAALELETAKTNLQMAEAAALNKKADQVEQPAYLAMQNARLAQARASAKADDARVLAGTAERDQIQLAARNREIENARATAAAASAKSSSLQAEIDALKAEQTARGLVITFGDVLFDTGKAELNPSAKPRLDQLAQVLREQPHRLVQVDGFTDNTGSDALNMELSRNRAMAVESSLLARGIDSTRITATGYGKSFPVASNKDASGRQLNRRVEVIISNSDDARVAPRSM